MTECHKYDDMLFHMLTECKTLPVFLDELFGFLYRRTDFYNIATDPMSPVGLPEGLAENIVKGAFYKWKPHEHIPEVLNEYEIPAVNEETVVSEEVCITESTEDLHLDDNVATNVELPKETSLDNNIAKIVELPKDTKCESYNGAVYDNYSWSQNISEIDITVKVPEGATKKDLTITILSESISVRCKELVLLEGALCEKCKHTEAIWAIDKRNLQIHLEKCSEKWWNCLVQTEPKLDLSVLDCSRPYEDLSEEAQAKIQELQWNAERKRLGLPTSDELAKRELLRKAWDAEGSPFSGPFDPSAVSLS